MKLINANAIQICCRQKVAEDGTAAGTNTIDEEEVANFNRQGDEWWKEEGEFVALHRLNDLRVPLIRDALLSQRTASGDSKAPTPEPLAGFSILDVGCGGGLLSEVSTIPFTIIPHFTIIHIFPPMEF